MPCRSSTCDSIQKISIFTKIIQVAWCNRIIPEAWKRATTILINKKDSTHDPTNFRPITLQSIPLRVLTSAVRNNLFVYSMKNNYIETNVQKGFTPDMTGSCTAQLAHIIRQAKKKQRSLVVTLLYLKNAFGEVHRNLIPLVLDYHHVPPELIEYIMSLYKDFATTVVTDSYTTSFLRIERGVLQDDSLSPLIFNLLINTFIQYVRQERFSQLGYSLSKLLRPTHSFQFADGAAIATGQEYKLKSY